MAAVVDKVFVELRQFFEPLNLALASPDEFAAFLREFGFALSGPDVVAAAAQLAPIRSSVLQLGATTRDAVAAGLNAADLVAIGNAVIPLFQNLRTINQSLSGLAPAGLSASAFAQSLQVLPDELFDKLLTEYLTDQAALVLHTLAFLDVLHTESIPASGDARSRGLAYSRQAYRWDRIGLLFDNASEWAEQTYGWGVDFQSDKFISRLVRIFEYIGGTAVIRDMSQAQAAVFVPEVAAAPVRPTLALAPIVKSRAIISSGAGPLEVTNEFGLALFPVSGKTAATRRSDAGIAIGPYTEGAIAQTIPLASNAALKLMGNVGAAGGIVYSFRPSGVSHDAGVDTAAFSGAFSAEIVVDPAAGQSKIVLIGRPTSTRVEIASAVASVGGSVTNSGTDFFSAVSIKALHVVVDASSDGLLGMLLGGPLEVEAGDLLLGWRSGRGLYFEGGTSIAVKIPIDRQLGPFHLYDVGLALDLNAASVTTTVTADARLGPLYAFVEGLGLTVTLVPNQNGTLGRYDLMFGLKLPTGYAVALDAPPIEGGGYLSIADGEYRGALALKFETFGLSAFAILNTKLPGGAPGFSFVASIFGDFVIPLGYGFFLTGLGGLIGINRTVNTDALRQVLYEGQLDSILFPADPIANAATILDNMAAIFPARQGQYVFGPMARIAFSQPALLTGKFGVVLEVGSDVRLLILGSVGTRLPTADAALVALEATFFGEIDFGAGTISFDATLQNSRVLFWSVSGDMAVRSGWAPRIDHIISFGGLHPSYPRPANLPDLRRMSINFGTNNPRVSLWSYQALTLNSLQFGAGADLYAKGPKIRFVGQLAAEGHVYFHALIYFNPFAFDVQLGGGLALLVDGDVAAGLGFDLRLTGPNNFVIDGKVWITIFGIDVDFGIHHSWGDRRQLPATVADPIAVLRAAIAAAPVLEPIPATALSDGVRFVQPRATEDGPRATSPVGGLRFSQRALPLAAAIEKVGEAQIVSAARTFDLAVFGGSGPVAVGAAELDFVRGHFWRLSEADRLRTPAYERHKSGFEIAAGDRLRVDTSRATDVEYGYEIVLIPANDVITLSPIIAFAATASTLAPVTRWMEAHHRSVAAPLDPIASVKKPADAPQIMKRRFAAVDAAAAAGPAAGFVAFSNLQRMQPADALLRRNAVVADYVLAGRA